MTHLLCVRSILWDPFLCVGFLCVGFSLLHLHGGGGLRGGEMVGGQMVGCGLSIPFVGSFLLFFSSSNSATVLRSCSTDLAPCEGTGGPGGAGYIQ